MLLRRRRCAGPAFIVRWCDAAGPRTSPSTPRAGVAGCSGTAPRVLVVVVALALVAAGGWYGYRTYIARDEPAAEGPPHPDQWDRRFAPLAAFVEKERGLTFEHPVYVRYLKPAAFEKALVSGKNEGTAEDEKELEQYAGLFRAVGLLADGVDLGAVTRTLAQAGTVGFYAFDDETIRVRGTRLTTEVRKTLVHSHPRAPGPALRHRQPVRGPLEGRGRYRFPDAAGGHRRGRLAPRHAVREDARAVGRRHPGRAAGPAPHRAAGRAAPPRPGGLQRCALRARRADAEARRHARRRGPTPSTTCCAPRRSRRRRCSTRGSSCASLQPHRRARRREPGARPPREGVRPGYVRRVRVSTSCWRSDSTSRTSIRASDGWGGDAYVGYEERGPHWRGVAYLGDTGARHPRAGGRARRVGGGRPVGRHGGPRPGGLTFDSCDPQGVGRKDPADEAVISFPLSRTQLLDEVLTQGIPGRRRPLLCVGVVEELSVGGAASPTRRRPSSARGSRPSAAAAPPAAERLTYQPRSASRCGCARSSTLMPTMASPRPRETLATIGRVVVEGGGLDDRLGALRRVAGLEDAGAHEHALGAELHHHRGVGRGGDAARGEQDDGQAAGARDLG